jgi:hypothetical protein
MGCQQESRASAKSQPGLQQQQRLQTVVSLLLSLEDCTVPTSLQQAVARQQQQLLQRWEMLICIAAGVQLAQQRRLQQQQQLLRPMG